MNRGFGFYFANAMRASVKTLWRKGNLIKYFAWVIMEFLSPVTLVLPALFALANVRQAKIAERDRTIDIPQAFKVASKAKPFGTMLLAIILEALIFLAGVILIGLASAFLGAIGYIICLFVDTLDPMLIILIFLAPGVLVLLIYCFIMPLLFAPTAYIIETNPDIGAGDAISICFNTMKSRGKSTYFLTIFIPALILGAILGLGGAVEFVLTLFITDIRLGIVLTILVGIIFAVGFMLVAPMFLLAAKISQKSLFEDIVLDPVNASKRTSGVNIKKCKGVKFDPAEYENELCALFDETGSDRVPVPETPSAKKKRQLEERKAARAASMATADYAKPVAETTAPTPTEPVPAPAPADTADEDGEEGLITVSDLIRDVEAAEPEKTEEPAPVTEEPVPEPVSEAATPDPASEEHAVEEPTPEPVKEEAPAPEPATEEPVTEAPVPDPVQEEPVKVEEPATEAPAPATADPEKTEEPAPVTEEPAPVKKSTRKPAATKTTVKAKTAEKSSTESGSDIVKAKTTSRSRAKKPTDGEEN